MELFDAREWPEKSSNDNEFRVRIDGKWHSPMGKYTFLSHEAVGRLVAALMSGQELPENEQPPDLATRQRVRVFFGDCVDSIPVRSQRGFVAAPPFRGIDGRWYVAVSTFDGTETYLCHDVESIRR